MPHADSAFSSSPKTLLVFFSQPVTAASFVLPLVDYQDASIIGQAEFAVQVSPTIVRFEGPSTWPSIPVGGTLTLHNDPMVGLCYPGGLAPPGVDNLCLT